MATKLKKQTKKLTQEQRYEMARKLAIYWVFVFPDDGEHEEDLAGFRMKDLLAKDDAHIQDQYAQNKRALKECEKTGVFDEYRVSDWMLH